MQKDYENNVALTKNKVGKGVKPYEYASMSLLFIADQTKEQHNFS